MNAFNLLKMAYEKAALFSTTTSSLYAHVTQCGLLKPQLHDPWNIEQIFGSVK